MNLKLLLNLCSFIFLLEVFVTSKWKKTRKIVKLHTYHAPLTPPPSARMHLYAFGLTLPPPSTYIHTLWMAPCDYIKNKYDKSKLYFTDTDSLMYEIKDEGVYEGFSSNKEMFDFSNDSTKWKYYDNSNKLVIGRMKDETGGVAIEEFVGLKSKMYSFLVENNKQKKAK